MKMKKVIKLIFSFATIKPIIKLATYSFQVITNYFNIRKNRVIKETVRKRLRKNKKKEQSVSRKMPFKSQKFQIIFPRFKTKPPLVIQIKTIFHVKKPTFHQMKVNQTNKARRRNHTRRQNAKSNITWATKALIGQLFCFNRTNNHLKDFICQNFVKWVNYYHFKFLETWILVRW